MVKSIGIIETLGYTAALKAADMMVKMAYVNVVSQEIVGAGIVATIIEGDIESVKIALEVGVEAIQYTGELVSVHSIAKPLFEVNREYGQTIEKDKTTENPIVENDQATICGEDGEDINEGI